MLAYFGLCLILKFNPTRTYLTTAHADDDFIVPLSKLLVFSEHNSEIRRAGVAAALK